MFNLLLHTGTVAEQTILANMFLLVAVAYGYGLYRIRSQQANHPWPFWHGCAFYAGLLVLAISMLSPIDTFNDELFFVHMIQHLLMALAGVPLILLGRPVQLAFRAMPRPWAKELGQRFLKPKAVRGGLAALSVPIVVAVIYNANLVFWHVPYLYELALSSEPVHYVMHMMFIGTAFLFWWPIIDPMPRHHKYSTGMTLAQIGFAMLAGKILGALITFSTTPIYDSYVEADRVWGISPLVDQQLSGLVMLVGAFIIYAVTFFVLLTRALLRADRRAVAKSQRRGGTTIRQVEVEAQHVPPGAD